MTNSAGVVSSYATDFVAPRPTLAGEQASHRPTQTSASPTTTDSAKVMT